ncbi:MAG: MaoC family dehydratase [Rhodospirillales bacterium]|nr:MaoC family dehydratase [Rhodospirillales bacterium]
MFPAYDRLGPGRYRQRLGLDFEDFAPGQRFRHRPGLTISQQDNVSEALATLNGAMIHFDDHYAAATSWGRPLVVSTLTLRLLLGMASKTYGRRTAILGFDEIALSAPLFGGDTLYAESEILAADPASAAITVAFTGRKPDGGGIGRAVARMRIARRGDPPATPAEEPRLAAYRADPDGALTEQSGLFFEDFAAGETFLHAPRRSFRAEESARAAAEAMELAPAYHDQDWIDRHADGAQRVSETFLIGAVTALTTRTFGRVVANLGWHDIALPAPVVVGDTIAAESTVLEARSSRSRPAEGILSVATRAINQHGAEVLRYRRSLLVYRRDADTPYGRAGY